MYIGQSFILIKYMRKCEPPVNFNMKKTHTKKPFN